MRERLPLELEVEILARVPVKRLIRFRCVCKSWRSLFQEKWFITQQTSYAPSRIMSSFTPFSHPVYSFIYENGKTKAQEVDLSGDQSLVQEPVLGVIGHCDGLFCLHFKDRSLAVWNPALRELRKIPAITTTRLNTETTFMGFGYDYSIQDYKILLVVPNVGVQEGCFEAQVLTVKSKGSRVIEFPSNYNRLCPETYAAVVGENLFWQTPKEEILSFSLASETFSYCSGPKLEKGEYRDLKVLSGNLHVIGTVRRDDYGKAFVLWCAQHDKDDKGVIKSWSIKFRFTLDNIGISIGSRVDRISLGNVILITETDMLLKVSPSKTFERRLGAYNFKEKRVTISETHLGYGRLFEYIETLISPRSLVL